MLIIEIDQSRFINMDLVFKIEFINVEKTEKYFIKFYSASESYFISKEFPNEKEARDWLNLCLLRSSGSHEILEL